MIIRFLPPPCLRILLIVFLSKGGGKKADNQKKKQVQIDKSDELAKPAEINETNSPAELPDSDSNSKGIPIGTTKKEYRVYKEPQTYKSLQKRSFIYPGSILFSGKFAKELSANRKKQTNNLSYLPFRKFSARPGESNSHNEATTHPGAKCKL